MAKGTRRRSITVVADCPRECTHEELAQYVEDALSTWGGQKRPPFALGDDDLGDPLFNSLKVHKVAVSQVQFYFTERKA